MLGCRRLRQRNEREQPPSCGLDGDPRIRPCGTGCRPGTDDIAGFRVDDRATCARAFDHRAETGHWRRIGSRHRVPHADSRRLASARDPGAFDYVGRNESGSQAELAARTTCRSCDRRRPRIRVLRRRRKLRTRDATFLLAWRSPRSQHDRLCRRWRRCRRVHQERTVDAPRCETFNPVRPVTASPR